MREIKFRAWDKKFNKMRYVTTIHYMPLNSSDKGKVASISSSSRYIKRQDCELMQYTGLKDKNGKEIYEGDIIRHYDSFPSEQKQQVVWHEHGFYFAWKDGLINHRLMSTEFFEVIGNIYENKELLEG